ncbi:M20 family metallopeptidase [Haloplanus salinarum]|uniref:M20 family metallopeptidase n=1 Tax=Haloplanus salinarum TaxID=1912324 RepID=UPI00214B6B62|nr:M20 family metallopeptidase [Haloplanus salinarum]
MSHQHSRTDDELTALIGELVSLETENPPGHEKRVAEFVHEWLTDRGIDATFVHEPYADRPQVVARVGDGEPTVVLNGHIDVVPAGDRDEWTHPPYAAEIDDGRLYGRGSADMKTGVAVGMMALADLGAEIGTDDLSGSIVFHAAIGEETGEPGTKTLLERGYGGDYGVVLEPTGMRTATSEKGLAWYEITVAGDPSHASRPEQGDNAITNARPVLDALESYDAEIADREDELVGQAHATVTKIEAGTKENVVPEDAVITIDRRFLPSESADAIDDEVDALLADVEADHGIETSWERTRTYESAAIDVDSDLADVFREQSAEHADISPDPWGVKGSTDVRNFVNDADIEAITWGPGELGQAHTYDESVDPAEAAVGLRTLKASVRELLE